MKTDLNLRPVFHKKDKPCLYHPYTLQDEKNLWGYKFRSEKMKAKKIKGL